jgi:hypothetical protein
MSHWISKLSLVVASFAILILWPRVAAAQTEAPGFNLTTSPLPISIATMPGKTVSENIRVRNSGPREETIRVGLLKFSADQISGKPVLAERAKGDNYFDWVTFTPSKLTLSPNEWGTVKMTIDVPKSAAFGYYYAVTFSRAGSTGQLPGQASLKGSAATLVLLEAKVPNAKREVKLEEFATASPWYEFLPVTFNVTLRNTGNVHAAPFGSIFIEKGGKPVDELKFNEVRGNILPQSPRQFDVDWKRGFPVYTPVTKNERVELDDRGQPKRELSWDFAKANNLRFGKYTAKLALAYDNGTRDVPIEKSIEFWVIPWRFLAAAGVLALFFGFGVFMFGRAMWKLVRRNHQT